MVAPEVVPGLKLLNRLHDGAGQRDQSVGPRHGLVVHDTSSPHEDGDRLDLLQFLKTLLDVSREDKRESQSRGPQALNG